MTTPSPLETWIANHLSRAARSASGWLTGGCIVGILVACLYNLLFLGIEFRAFAEVSWSEEKVTYPMRLFAKRVILGAVVGAFLGVLVEALLRRASSKPGND